MEADGLSDERLRELFREMLLIRRFEEKVEERFRAGELPGFLHVAIGQEAVAAGVMAALEPDDVIASTHRAHGHTIAKGTHVNAIMAELYGKLEGCSQGYGGSMHLYDLAKGNLGANAVVGGGFPAIVGAALAFQFRKQPRVGVAFFGDGATNTGTFHESLNLAQLWKVPALFVLEMNGWAESTPISQHAPIEDFSRRAVAFGMRSIDVDGQDVEAVYAATREAREHAVSGAGPVFLNVRTYRLVGHYIGDPQVYREKSEIEELRETKDPIELLRARLDRRRRVRGARHRDRARSSRSRWRSRRREPTRGPRTRSSTSMPELTYRGGRGTRSRARCADDDYVFHGRGHRRDGRLDGRHAGAGRVRARARTQYPDLGDGDRRHRDRRRDAGDAAGRRDHVPGLPDALDGAARQPGGEAPDDERRPAEGAADDPHPGRRRLEPGAQHAQQLESWFVHVPGLKVVFPSTPEDARGLLWSSIYDDNTVIFFEHRLLYPLKGEVPDEIEPIPLGKARVMREGSDVTVVAIGRMVPA